MTKKKSAAKAPTKKAPQAKTAPRKSPPRSVVRYRPEKKAEILTFVRDYDKTHGKGGQTMASKRFGVSTLSIWTWMKAGAKPKKKTVAEKAAPLESSNSDEMIGRVPALRRMVEIQEEIEGLKAQFEDLKRAI
jgi:hypothetical protein